MSKISLFFIILILILNTYILYIYQYIYYFRWFSLRQEAEIYYNLPITKNPCPRGGHKHYKPMQLDKVQLPLYNETELYRVSDHSLDRYIPIKEAKYISNHYN